ncbi:unnamed protein product [Cylindrotheca closterium]|uniref:Phosphodiesterase n=1 Tax=Cylindrotheca closterium TaxID=2856 RepID=A0AAD2CPE6_9STRA|nr:unnamed protein product [Cylindrotheca closterium]
MATSAVTPITSVEEASRELSADTPPPMPSRAALEHTSSLGNSNDTKLINRSKCVVYLVLFLSAAIVSVSVFLLAEEEDKRWYTDEFEERADEVVKGVESSLLHSVEASGNMGGSWTLQTTQDPSANGANGTYANFAVLGEALSSNGLTQVMTVAPVVTAATRTQWEAYAVENQRWIVLDLLLLSNAFGYNVGSLNPGEIPERIYGYDNEDTAAEHLPIWQMFPPPQNASQSPIMFDLLSIDWFADLWNRSLYTSWPAVSAIQDLDFLVDYAGYEREEEVSSPKFVMVQPIFGGYEVTDGITAAATSVISWADYFAVVLGDQPSGIIVDIHHNCPQSNGLTYSFKKTQDSIVYLGENVDIASLDVALTKDYNLFGEGAPGPRAFLGGDSCGYILTVHATTEFIELWQRDDSFLASATVLAIFGFTALVFFTYDFYVQRRNRRVTNTAARSTAIVSSLFPKNVAAQMMEEIEEATTTRTGKRSTKMSDAVQQLVGSSNLSQGNASALAVSKKAAPIADLFEHTTIMFADIAGFTKWSSTHEPSDVFTLLETIFNAFDNIADKRHVFKVETVGDCYVAVCGLPDPCRDHAIVMARFAWECMRAMRKIRNKLEKKLGADTRELDMRFGLHSGPVTAGVIRGQRPRFQLFGDSMNKTSRIESSGQKGKVHISDEMANILKDSGKEHWLSKREDVVNLKGLGEVPTYWLGLQNERHSATGSVTSISSTDPSEPSSNDELALIKNQINDWKNLPELTSWHSKFLAKFLVRVVHARQASGRQIEVDEEGLQAAEKTALFGHADPSDCIQFESTTSRDLDSQTASKLDKAAMDQLKDFVQQISDAYNPHPFHNVQHASHVVTSLKKLLESSQENPLDPLTEFALVLSAFVHDVDHPGVSNEQLVAENEALAKIYESSPAERNSLDVFWNIFCQESFRELRRTVYQTTEELEHFRQVMVQSILSTDIIDKSMQQDRIKRWEGCLKAGGNATLGQRKTCIVEQLIQVSDIAHTMQHWGLYQKWNGKLYDEISAAFHNGRGGKNPKEFWYKGEQAFYNDIVIPVATLLSEEVAFRTSGRAMLQNAKDNLREWRGSGKEVLASL